MLKEKIKKMLSIVMSKKPFGATLFLLIEI